MTQHSDDKELIAAFAEFKELLRRDSGPGVDAPGQSAAPIVTPHPPSPAAKAPDVAAPKLRMAEPDHASGAAFAPTLPQAPRADESWRAARSDEIAFSADGEERSRKKLIFLSAAIVVVGLGALGWTLTHAPNGGASDASAVAEAAAPEAEPAAEAVAAAPQPSADTAALGAIAGGAEPPAKETGESTPTEAAIAPAGRSDQTPPSAESATTGEPAPAPAKPVSAPIVPAPAPKAAAVEPLAPAPTAALESPPPAAAPETPAAAPKAKPEPRAAQAGPTKVKPKPAAQSAERPRPKNGKTARNAPEQGAPPAAAAMAPPVEPAPPPAPAPAPAQSEGGAFGFVKRTVNSVGSTIGNIGRSAAGIIP